MWIWSRLFFLYTFMVWARKMYMCHLEVEVLHALWDHITMIWALQFHLSEENFDREWSLVSFSHDPYNSHGYRLVFEIFSNVSPVSRELLKNKALSQMKVKKSQHFLSRQTISHNIEDTSCEDSSVPTRGVVNSARLGQKIPPITFSTEIKIQKQFMQ